MNIKHLCILEGNLSNSFLINIFRMIDNKLVKKKQMWVKLKEKGNKKNAAVLFNLIFNYLLSIILLCGFQFVVLLVLIYSLLILLFFRFTFFYKYFKQYFIYAKSFFAIIFFLIQFYFLVDIQNLIPFKYLIICFHLNYQYVF